MWIEPENWTFVKWCSYPFQIKMNVGPQSTSATDAKLVLSGAEIANVIDGDMDVLGFGTGIATVGPQTNLEYQYFNIFQLDRNSAISGNDIVIANIELMFETGNTNTQSFANFYFLNPLRNGDDSNIAVWNSPSNGNYYTQYSDVLNSVSGGIYNMQNSWPCFDAPIILSGLYQWHTYVDSGYDILDTTVWITAGLDFDYPNSYNWDDNWDSRLNDTWRTARTNSAVYLIITWDIPIMIETANLAGLPITVLNNTIHSTWKTIIITWNLNSQPLIFSYYGSTWNEYDYVNLWTWIFVLDVFWIDKDLAGMTWSFELKNDIIYVTLSGYSSGVNWSIVDDEFKILWFSGISAPPTDYLTSANNVFDNVHTLWFLDSWSGDMIYVDRAGNTWTYFLYIPPPEEYIIKAYPQWRLITSTTPNPNLTTKWLVSFWDKNKNFIASGYVTTNHYGTGIVKIMPSLSWIYFVGFEWLSHLQTIASGVLLDDSQREIDFTDHNLTRYDGMLEDDIVHYQLDYTEIGGNNYLSNLEIRGVFGYEIRDGMDLQSISNLWTQINSGVKRTNISLSSGANNSVSYQTTVLDPNVTWLLSEPIYRFWSGSSEISASSHFGIATGTEIVAIEIVGEIIKDWEINGVDSSTLVWYIANNGATNTNNQFWLVKEDLNANWQVDAADISVLGYNLYRTAKSFP